MKPPNLAILTEFVKRGNLKEIINDPNTKLSWMQKLSMLKSAALGINYLHSLSPVRFSPHSTASTPAQLTPLYWLAAVVTWCR
jgi:hypothetical protein